MNNWLLCLPGLASAVVIREDTMVRERRTKSHFAIVTDIHTGRTNYKLSSEIRPPSDKPRTELIISFHTATGVRCKSQSSLFGLTGRYNSGCEPADVLS